MGKLTYTAITSLDGYVNDRDGRFDWSAPDAEVHAHVNDQVRMASTQLYGRRMYEVLLAWETMPDGPDQPAEIVDYARIWRAADKIVYSTTLTAVSSARTRLEPAFRPEDVRRLKDQSSAELGISGPTLAAQAFRAGLVDEVRLYLNPVAVGGGTPALPPDLRLRLELIDEHRFGNGVVLLGYRVIG